MARSGKFLYYCTLDGTKYCHPLYNDKTGFNCVPGNMGSLTITSNNTNYYIPYSSDAQCSDTTKLRYNNQYVYNGISTQYCLEFAVEVSAVPPGEPWYEFYRGEWRRYNFIDHVCYYTTNSFKICYVGRDHMFHICHWNPGRTVNICVASNNSSVVICPYISSTDTYIKACDPIRTGQYSHCYCRVFYKTDYMYY